MIKEKQKFKETILFDPEKCSGCKACEIACSFRKRNFFSPGGASLKINHRPLEREISAEFFKSCDLCFNLEVPFCIEFCATGALALGRK